MEYRFAFETNQNYLTCKFILWIFQLTWAAGTILNGKATIGLSMGCSQYIPIWTDRFYYTFTEEIMHNCVWRCMLLLIAYCLFLTVYCLLLIASACVRLHEALWLPHTVPTCMSWSEQTQQRVNFLLMKNVRTVLRLEFPTFNRII